MRHKQTDLTIRAWALLCLVAHLVLATPFLPWTAALAAWVDGEHEVRLEGSPNGVRLVLHHSGQTLETLASHTHCPVSQALVLFSSSGSPSQPDHVLSFVNAKLTTLRSGSPLRCRDSVPPVHRPLPYISCITRGDSEFGSYLKPFPSSNDFKSLPQPQSIAIVRSTVFLI